MLLVPLGFLEVINSGLQVAARILQDAAVGKYHVSDKVSTSLKPLNSVTQSPDNTLRWLSLQ